MNLALAIAFTYGIIIGSFLNVLILRLPQGRSIGGRSECVTCKRQLTAWDLIPVVSYFSLRGKCRGCSSPISPRYFIIELLTGLFFALALYVLSPVTAMDYIVILRTWLILAVLIVVFVIDLEHFLILDKVIYPAAVLVLGLNIVLDLMSGVPFISLSGFTVGGLVSGLISFGFFFALWSISKGKWIGFGDVKFMIFLGLALAWPNIWVGLFLAFVLGGLVGTGLLLFGNKTMQSKLPLGTFLAVGAVAGLLWGGELLAWYLGLVGVV